MGILVGIILFIIVAVLLIQFSGIAVILLVGGGIGYAVGSAASDGWAFFGAILGAFIGGFIVSKNSE